MSAYLLDTNIVSQIIRGDQPDILRKLARLPMGDMVPLVTRDRAFSRVPQPLRTDDWTAT